MSTTICDRCKNPWFPYASAAVRQGGQVCTCDVFAMPQARTGAGGRNATQERGKASEPAKRAVPDLEQMYLDILAEHAPGLPKPLRQQEIVPGRKFTTDFCWPVEKVAVEIEGACHRTEQRFYSDAEKQCLLTVNGWRVLRFTGRMLRGQVMQVVEWTRKALGK